MKSYRLLIMVLLAGVYITVDGQLQESLVDSVGNAGFLLGRRVKRIIELPADKLLILTDTAIHIILLKIYSNGAVNISSDAIRRTIQTNVSLNNQFKDAILLNDTHVVITSLGCLKAVVITSGDIRTYAGSCTDYGARDGLLLEARFSSPHTMLMIQQVIYVMSAENTPIRLVSEERVSSLLLNDLNALRPYYMTSCVGSYLYITYLNGLAQLDIANNTHIIISGSGDVGFSDDTLNMSRFYIPAGLVMLGPNIILVADYYNFRLRIIDRSNNSVQSICDGSQRSVDGNFRLCSLYYPRSILLYKNLLLVGERGKIRFIQRSVIVNDVVFNRTKCPNLRGNPITTSTLPATTSAPITVIRQTSTTLPEQTGISATIRSITTQSITTQSITTQVNQPSKMKTTNLVIGILVTVVCLALLAGGIYLLIRKGFIRKSSKVGNSSNTKRVKNASKSVLQT